MELLVLTHQVIKFQLLAVVMVCLFLNQHI